MSPGKSKNQETCRKSRGYDQKQGNSFPGRLLSKKCGPLHPSHRPLTQMLPCGWIDDGRAMIFNFGINFHPCRQASRTLRFNPKLTMSQAPDPLTPPRQLIDYLSSRFHVICFFLMSMGSASLFCAVLLASHFHVWGFSEEELRVIDELPVSVVMLGVGLGGFVLFFPMFLALYGMRWVLSEIRRLEKVISDR
jgi:hypothetical protein